MINFIEIAFLTNNNNAKAEKAEYWNSIAIEIRHIKYNLLRFTNNSITAYMVKDMAMACLEYPIVTISI